MKFLIITFILSCLGLNTIQAKEIYKWLDVEGIKQFSSKPPPASCRTPSCIKLNKQISKRLQRKKEAELGRIEAKKIQQEENKKKKKQHSKAIKLSPANDQSQKTFLPLVTVLCLSYKNIKEFKQVPRARKYLERDQVCTKTNEETEYTIIERQDDFSNIRIYLSDGSSQKKWVETRYLLDKSN